MSFCFKSGGRSLTWALRLSCSARTYAMYGPAIARLNLRGISVHGAKTVGNDVVDVTVGHLTQTILVISGGCEPDLGRASRSMTHGGSTPSDLSRRRRPIACCGSPLLERPRLAWLSAANVIALCEPTAEFAEEPNVRIAIGRPGVDHDAVMHSSDAGTLIALVASARTAAPSVAEALERIAAGLAQAQAASC